MNTRRKTIRQAYEDIGYPPSIAKLHWRQQHAWLGGSLKRALMLAEELRDIEALAQMRDLKRTGGNEFKVTFSREVWFQAVLDGWEYEESRELQVSRDQLEFDQARGMTLQYPRQEGSVVYGFGKRTVAR